MSNPLARLLGQAEFNLTELSRRAAESVAAPIKAKSQEVVSEVVGTATGALKALIIKAVLGLLAGVMLIVAIVYVVAALYWYLLPILGPVEARLAIAGVFLVIALVAVLAMLFWPKGSPGGKLKASSTKQARRVMAETAPRGAPSEEVPAAMDLKAGVEALASILGDAGYRREQAGLRTGMALASQLKPIQIVSLALVGGYVAGLRFAARRR